MHRIDPYSVRLFLSIIEEGSIARAAAREHIVASAVSRRLGELESMFGVPLVERGVHGVRATPAGEALAHHARLLHQTIERLDLEMTGYRRGIRGLVKVRASASALACGLPQQLQAWTEANDSVQLDLEEMDTPQVFHEVRNGQADLGVAPDIVRHEGLTVLPYHRYDLCAVVPDTHPLARYERIGYGQVLDYEQVDLTSGSALSALLDGAASHLRRVKRTRIRAMGFSSVCHLVATGMGIGVGPSFLASTHGPMYRLRFVPLDEQWAHPVICLLVRNSRELPTAVVSLFEHLKRAWPAPA